MQHSHCTHTSTIIYGPSRPLRCALVGRGVQGAAAEPGQAVQRARRGVSTASPQLHLRIRHHDLGRRGQPRRRAAAAVP